MIYFRENSNEYIWRKLKKLQQANGKSQHGPEDMYFLMAGSLSRVTKMVFGSILGKRHENFFLHSMDYKLMVYLFSFAEFPWVGEASCDVDLPSLRARPVHWVPVDLQLTQTW